MDGRGRTGLLSALLLGRLYGLTSHESLERAQRCHDCKRSVQNIPSTRSTSSPEAMCQIRLVQQILSYTDTIYETILIEGDDNYHVVRHQKRGVSVQINMNGFMIDEIPDEDERLKEFHKYKKMNRIAKKESEALRLIECRKSIARERELIQNEDYNINGLN